jgi:ankyrin repeat protein
MCRHLAASHGFLEVVKRIFAENPFALSETSPEGYTPLHVACIHGHADVAQFLIDEGVDKMKQDGYGKHPRFYAHRWLYSGNRAMDGIWDILEEE